jgi:hypothetical protein
MRERVECGARVSELTGFAEGFPFVVLPYRQNDILVPRGIIYPRLLDHLLANVRSVDELAGFWFFAATYDPLSLIG